MPHMFYMATEHRVSFAKLQCIVSLVAARLQTSILGRAGLYAFAAIKIVLALFG